MFNPSHWYWLRVSDGATYSSAAKTRVLSSDTGYVAWVAAGFRTTPWPVDSSGSQTSEALVSVLEAFGLPTSGV